MKREYSENLSFPVVGYKLVNGHSKTDNLFGTASYLNNNIFITAAHTILNAKESEFMGIAFRDNLERESGYTYHPIEEFEIFDDLDIGLLKLKEGHKNAKAEKWTTKETEMLEDVFSLGFPFGLNITEKEFIVRGLKGHIVTRRKFHEFPKKPSVYELSFHCPKGISGASLRNLETWHTKGFIIANASTEILVFEEREIDEDKTEKVFFKSMKLPSMESR